MKIIAVSSSTYSQVEASLWKDDKFQPISDYKIKIELGDGSVVEAGVFEVTKKPKREFHACISTQAGCKFKCSFCSSGASGFERDLSRDEILKEISLLARLAKVESFDRLMYMGIGEPLDNFDNVVGSIQQLLEINPRYIGRISLATIGILPKLHKLALLKLPLRRIWVSLHAASDEKRVKIMPISKVYKAKELVVAAKAFAKISGTETWLNYMIFQDFNDSLEDASMLVELLKDTEDDLSVVITVPNGERSGYIGGSLDDVHRFQNYLIELGMKNHTEHFFSVGHSSNAGCGEFVFYPISTKSSSL